MSAGFRESGIAGVLGDDPNPHIGIRTQGLALESIIAFQDSTDKIRLMVSEEYLRTLLAVANLRFVANDERKARFARNFLCGGKEGAGKTGDAGEWEPADVRRERKRAEGLRRKEEMQRRNQLEAAGDGDEDVTEIALGFPGEVGRAAKGDPLPATKPKMLGERGHGPVVHSRQSQA